jgi:putative hydrolase of the HAD superfamily
MSRQQEETTEESDIQAIFSAASSPLDPIPTDAVEVLLPLSNIRAVLFDVYGTLVLSGSGDVGTTQLDSKHQAICAALVAAGILKSDSDLSIDMSAVYTQAIMDVHASKERSGIRYPEVDIVDIWRKVIGCIPKEQSTQRQHGAEIKEKLLRRVAVEFEVRSNPTWPMPGALDLIQSLADHRIPLGIVSNAQFYTPIMLRSFWGNLTRLGFEERYCTWSYRIGEAKPATVMFERILAALAEARIEPCQVVYIGNDMLNDVFTAKSAGLKAVLFGGDMRSFRLRADTPECSTVEPDAVITHFSQFSKLTSLRRYGAHAEG